MRHNLRTVWLMLAWIILTGPVYGGDRGTGVGLIVGEPSGVSIKQWVTEVFAVDAAMAWSFDRNTSVKLHATALIHDHRAFRMRYGYFPFYAGVGVFTKLKDERRDELENRTHTEVGLRFPIGIAFVPDNDPVDIFFEIVPILNLAPSKDFDLKIAIGIRYFFP